MKTTNSYRTTPEPSTSLRFPLKWTSPQKKSPCYYKSVRVYESSRLLQETLCCDHSRRRVWKAQRVAPREQAGPLAYGASLLQRKASTRKATTTLIAKDPTIQPRSQRLHLGAQEVICDKTRAGACTDSILVAWGVTSLCHYPRGV